MKYQKSSNSLTYTALSTFISAMAGLFFNDYFPYLPAVPRHFLTSFIIGACMTIFFERHRKILRASLSGFLFMLLSTPDKAYVLLWGPPLFSPFITLFCLQGIEGFDFNKTKYLYYLGLSLFSVVILICTLIVYSNAQLIIEGYDILQRAY